MIQVDTDHTYLIRWLVFPTSDRNNIRVVCHCNLFSTSVDGGNDVRQWVSKCRRSLGLGGWDWTDGSSAEIPPPEDYEDTVHNPLIHSLSSQRLLEVPQSAKFLKSNPIITSYSKNLNSKSEDVQQKSYSNKSMKHAVAWSTIVAFTLPVLLFVTWSLIFPFWIFLICLTYAKLIRGQTLKEEENNHSTNPYTMTNSLTNTFCSSDYTCNTSDSNSKNAMAMRCAPTQPLRRGKYMNTNFKRMCERNRIDQNTVNNTFGSMYKELIEPFENELNEFNPGQELLIISRDMLSLLPYSAMVS
eukprot:gene9895-20585_t